MCKSGLITDAVLSHELGAPTGPSGPAIGRVGVACLEGSHHLGNRQLRAGSQSSLSVGYVGLGQRPRHHHRHSRRLTVEG